jgi:putative transposase
VTKAHNIPANSTENCWQALASEQVWGDVGTSWDNAVVERFFGSLKHDWIFKIAQPTREHMKKNVAAYMRYYNLERLHTSNGNQPPINYENSLKKVSGWR